MVTVDAQTGDIGDEVFGSPRIREAEIVAEIPGVFTIEEEIVCSFLAQGEPEVTL